MEEISWKFEIAHIIEKVSKASEFWYQHETYLEISYLKQNAKVSKCVLEIKWVGKPFESCWEQLRFRAFI